MTSLATFQLTILSQNPSSCICGQQLSATVVGIAGGKLRKESSATGMTMPLPTAAAPGVIGSPYPTWILDLGPGEAIEAASFTVIILGPCIPPTTIAVPGARMGEWLSQNRKEKTNQIYLDGNCGIIGYAEKLLAPDQKTRWLYTITAGVTNPPLHPSI